MRPTIRSSGTGMHSCRMVLLVAVLCMVPPVQSRSLTDDYYFAYGVVNWHSRDGIIDFGDGRLQHFERKLLRTQGIGLGKNFALPFGLRVAVPLYGEYGSVREGTVEGVVLEDGSTPQLLYSSIMYHIGCQPMIQFPLRLSDGVWGFAAIGGGVHYVNLKEEERIDTDRKTRVIDDYLEKSGRFSASAAAGAGMEFVVSKQFVFSVQYLFRFWKPVQRKTSRDLFPLESMPYSELFFTHGISVGFLFARGH